MDKVLKHYQARLANISRRHRAFFFSRVVMKRSFDVATLDELEKGLSQKLYTAIVEKQKPFILSKKNLESKSKQKLVSSFQYLIRDLDVQEKERGFSECYLGDMFIEGNLDDGTYIRAPLVLYPVKLAFSRSEQTITITPIGSETLNKTLLLGVSKYDSQFHTITLSQIRKLESEDGRLADVIRPFLEKRGFSLTTDSKGSRPDSFQKVKPLTKESSPTNLKHKLNVLPYCVLGQFLQLSSTVNFDYELLLKEHRTNTLFNILTGITPYEFTPIQGVDFSESDLYTFSIPDSSQERVIKQVEDTDGLVIHGPPGTGKSQVLSNILVDQLARGKKLLVVCEKRAAIDVLYQKLAGAKLAQTAVVVHDAEAKQKDIGATLLGSIEEREQHADIRSKRNSVSEKPLAQKQLDHCNTEFDSTLAQQKALSTVLFGQTKFSLSLYDLYAKMQQFVSQKEPVEFITLNNSLVEETTDEKRVEYVNSFSLFANDISRIRDSSYPFVHRTSFANVDELELQERIESFAKKTEILCDAISKHTYQHDLELLSSNRSFSQNKLSKMGDHLVLFNKHKDSILRFMNPKWLYVHFTYRKLIREEELLPLVKRWELFSRDCTSFFVFLDEISHLFTTNFQKHVLELLIEPHTGRKSHPLMKFTTQLQKASVDFDLLKRFDTFYTDLSEREQNLFEQCVETFSLSSSSDLKQSWVDTIDASFTRAWINSLEMKYDDIQSFTFTQYNQVQKKLQVLLEEKTALVPKVILESSYELLSEQKAQRSYSQLVHDLGKKRNRFSLRELVAKHEDILLELFPIWMCSPEQVSNVFSLKPDLFDVILFDEASQLKIEQILPAIVRAKKLIVSGDEKQLPPSNFFQAGVDSDVDEDEDYTEDEKDLLEDESLLVRAKTVFPTQKLAYHYRSTDPSLIDFSNHAFYGGDLKVIPRNGGRLEKRMSFTKVSGTWHNNTNEVEAKAVVRDIIYRLSKKTTQTLGVITFNVKQRDLILDMLDSEAKLNTTFAKKYDAALNRYEDGEFVGFFVKNIESVQGDERDAIIFSIGYGFTKAKTFRYNFGPLNGVYGPNRLNVAISRAKNEVSVFCSFDPRDFSYTGNNEGPKLLGEYLAFVKAQSEGSADQANAILQKLSTGSDAEISIPTDLFVQDVYKTLKSKGLHVAYNVGATGYRFDVGVLAKDKKSYVCVIECDGSIAHQIPSIKERDVFRPKLLTSFGWNIKRVFARDWLKNKDAQVKRIMRACEEKK